VRRKVRMESFDLRSREEGTFFFSERRKRLGVGETVLFEQRGREKKKKKAHLLQRKKKKQDSREEEAASSLVGEKETAPV